MQQRLPGSPEDLSVPVPGARWASVPHRMLLAVSRYLVEQQWCYPATILENNSGMIHVRLISVNDTVNVLTYLTLWRPLLPYGYSYKASYARPSECPDVKNYKWRLNPVWHRMLCSCNCTHMTTVGVKGLTYLLTRQRSQNWTCCGHTQTHTDIQTEPIIQQPMHSLRCPCWSVFTFDISTSSIRNLCCLQCL